MVYNLLILLLFLSLTSRSSVQAKINVSCKFLFLLCKHWSSSDCLKLCCSNIRFNFSFQALAAFFGLYKLPFCLQNTSSCFWLMKPDGCSIYNSTAISPCRNAVLMSRCLICFCLETATLGSILMQCFCLFLCIF